MALLKLYGIFMAMPVHTIAIVYIIPIYRNQYEGMLRRATLATVALVYLGWFPAHLAYLANYRELYAYVLFLMFGTELNDAAAFFAGKLFGRRPLVSRISPGKTVEGALGALVVVLAYVLATRAWLPRFGWVEWTFSVVVLWIGGTMGDLVMSFIKRETHQKDMGTLIPGHGGVLDRFDSLLFVANIEAEGARIPSVSPTTGKPSFNSHRMMASVSVIPVPLRQQLQDYTDRVMQSNQLFRLELTRKVPREKGLIY